MLYLPGSRRRILSWNHVMSVVLRMLQFFQKLCYKEQVLIYIKTPSRRLKLEVLLLRTLQWVLLTKMYLNYLLQDLNFTKWVRVQQKLQMIMMVQWWLTSLFSQPDQSTLFSCKSFVFGCQQIARQWFWANCAGALYWFESLLGTHPVL